MLQGWSLNTSTAQKTFVFILHVAWPAKDITFKALLIENNLFSPEASSCRQQCA
jgi:hypothetical protein